MYSCITFYYHLVNNQRESDTEFWNRINKTLTDMNAIAITFESIYCLGSNVLELFDSQTLKMNSLKLFDKSQTNDSSSNEQQHNYYHLSNMHKYFDVIGCRIYYQVNEEDK